MTAGWKTALAVACLGVIAACVRRSRREVADPEAQLARIQILEGMQLDGFDGSAQVEVVDCVERWI